MQTRFTIRLVFITAAMMAMPMPCFAQDNAPPAVDPNAIAALEKMGAYLRSLTEFEVMATTLTDEIVNNDMKVQFGGIAMLKVHRPDRMRAEISSDRKQRQLIYDGKTLTVYGPVVKYYATVPAPPTLRELAQALAQKYGIEMPFADLFYWGTEQAPVADINYAQHLGPAMVDGTKTEHYVFRQEGVDWQVWIEQGKTPLPHKLVITTTSEAAQPAHITTMRWNVVPKFDAATFAFKPPPGAMRIVLQTADGKVEPASK